MSFKCDNPPMKYEIETTNIFDKWLAGIKDIKHRARIISRFDHIQLGNFGDHKAIADQSKDIDKANRILIELEQ